MAQNAKAVGGGLVKAAGGRKIWTAAERAAVVAESFKPNAVVAQVARKHGLNRKLLSTWRRRAREMASPPSLTEQAFAPIAVDRQLQPVAHSGFEAAPVEVTIGSARVQIRPGADAHLVATLIAALMKTAGRL